MNELRDEIRTAFEREQAAHRSSPTLRRDIVAAVSSHPRPAPNLQWVAVAAAALLTIAIVAGLMSARLANHGVPSHPKPSPSPVIDYGQPPAGVALIYVADPQHPGWYNGFDWSGTPRGTVKLATPISDQLYLTQSPDGQLFEVANGKGAVYFLDRLGNQIPQSQALGPIATWADDNRHVCAVIGDGTTLKFSLVTLIPGQSGHQVGEFGEAGNGSNVLVAACSFTQGRVVAVESTNGSPGGVWVIRLSDGKIVSHRTYTAGTLAAIVVSPDGSLIAEDSATSNGSLMGSPAQFTLIRRTSNDSVVVSLDPHFGVIAFSTDDSVALVNTSPWASGVATQLALVNVQTGSVIWRAGGQDELVSVVAEPAGTGFALVLQNPHVSTLHPPVRVLIVHADGTAAAIPGSYRQP